MTKIDNINTFLLQYDEQVLNNVLKLRKVLLNYLPNIIEQIDIPAKMIAYTYGQKYTEMVCTIIPSKKGLKLGFYKGMDLSGPTHLLKGNGKISRYFDIKTSDDIYSNALQELVSEAFIAYKIRNNL